MRQRSKTDSHPGRKGKSEMIKSRRTPQRLGISRLLFRAHGAGIKLNPRRHFSLQHLFPAPLFPADPSGALSIPLPPQPPCGSVLSLCPRSCGLCLGSFCSLWGCQRARGSQSRGARAETVVAGRGAPSAKDNRARGSLRGCDEPGGWLERARGGAETAAGAGGRAGGSPRSRAPGAREARSVRGPLHTPAGAAGAAAARGRAAAPLPPRRGRLRQVPRGLRASPRPARPAPAGRGAGGGGRGARRGGLVGRRGPAFPLRIPGAMRGGDGPEPAGLAP